MTPQGHLDQITRPKRRALIFLLIWLALAAIFVLAHFHFFFLERHTEIGDFAANGLQIRKAKFFQEIYGNYSRWGFHHPGPGFFYVYALGEWIFHDFLRIIPSPVNAHIVAGILLQTGLFVWGISIIQRHLGQWLVVPLLLVLGALHFGVVNFQVIQDSAFQSIWPPHVLLFPFFCCLVACASLAAGSGRDILPAVFCACLLVHGHVAQPLFVFPFVLLALLGLAGNCRARMVSYSEPFRSFPVQSVAAAVILLLALIPIAIDASRGQESNLRQILTYFSTQAADRKTLLQSLLYLACFACYLAQPEVNCAQLTRESLNFLEHRWVFALLWTLILLAALLLARRLCRTPFLRWLYLYIGLGVILTIIWGMLQAGPLYAFNSYFNYALYFLILSLPGIALSQWTLTPLRRPLLVSLVVLAFPLFFATAQSWRFDVDLPHSNVLTFPDLRPAAQATPSLTKFLLFEGDYWAGAAPVGLELQRAGYDYAVRPEQVLQFDREHTRDLVTALSRDNLALWRLGPRTTDSPGAISIGPNFMITFLPPPIDPDYFEITFSGAGPTAPRYGVTGWSFSDGPFSWSDQKTALLYFQPEPAINDIEMSLDVFPGTFPALKSQRIAVRFRDVLLGSWELAEPRVLSVRIPVSLWNQPGPATITFEFPDAVSPLALGVSNDPRTIGYGFRTISFRSANP